LNLRYQPLTLEWRAATPKIEYKRLIRQRLPGKICLIANKTINLVSDENKRAIREHRSVQFFVFLTVKLKVF
jgi:hypothetical protein